MLALLLQTAQAPQTAATQIGEPNGIAMAFFFLFIATSLGITYWAARRTRTTEHF
jgi:cation/acetate symporter